MNSPAPASKSKRGRPRADPQFSRPNRVVTFVTDWERDQLERVSREEERSMASVVHRIIKANFEKD
jgi:hypothetical protein